MKRSVVLAMCLLSGVVVHAANYPFQVLIPRPANSALDPGEAAISPHHRIFRAYPDVEYNIRAAVTWPSPVEAGSPHSVSVRVTDAEGTQVTRTWTLTSSILMFAGSGPPDTTSPSSPRGLRQR